MEAEFGGGPGSQSTAAAVGRADGDGRSADQMECLESTGEAL